LLGAVGKNKLVYSLMITLISYAICTVCQVISVIIEYLPYFIFKIYNKYVNLLLILLIQFVLIYRFFKIKRFDKGFKYLHNKLNNDYIDIEGFVNFRMKEFNKYLFDVADLALEDYLIKKDQDEFISVLKYFIDIQEEKLNLLKVHIKKDNTFILYDELGNKIDSIDDEELINMVIKENLNYEDFLISTLLTLCPKKIEIIDHLNNNCSMEIIDTIKSIFGERVISTYKN